MIETITLDKGWTLTAVPNADVRRTGFAPTAIA